MNFDNFSDQSKILINNAKNLVIANDQQHVLPEHILKIVISSDDNIVYRIFKDLNIRIPEIIDELNKYLEKIPKVSGKNITIFLSNELINLFSLCEVNLAKFGDSFISPEIIIYSMLENKNLNIYKVLVNSGLNKKEYFELVKNLRKGKKVDSASSDQNYDALEKYSTNLTEMAKNGKLDPVIGREEEIRRSIQVLSRRTKNNPVLIGEPGVGKTAIVEGLAIRIINDDVPESLKEKNLISLDLGSLIAGAKFRGDFEERLKLILNEITNNNDGIILFIDEIHTLVGAGKSEGAMDASNLLKPALARGELHCIGATTIQEYRLNIEKDAALARRFQKILINEPSNENSVSILRGLKEKYEIHHGVKILDSAIISAVELSQRYINDRYLPDKAIDLMDEAASRVRIQVDSKPEKLDEIERKILQNKIEFESLKKESDLKSKERLEKLSNEIKFLENKFNVLNEKWVSEKNKINEIQKLKLEVEENKNKLIILQRSGKLTEAGELAYGKIPQLEKSIEKLERKKKDSNNEVLTESVTSNEIAQIVAKWTGIPVNRMIENEKKKLLNIKHELSKMIVGQKHAVNVISSAIQRSRTEIQDPNRPIGIFIFLGPTGVGKTELTKALSYFLFNDFSSMLRIDMSEFMEKHSISKLIGAPPGYVGFDSGGFLTESIRKKPYQVILFDEIEKAHFDIFNLLLQVFDEGRLSDSKGNVINFRNTIIIMTSNIGAEILNSSDNQKEKIDIFTQEKILEEVRKKFKPEFINRLDDIIIFNRLTKEEIKSIVRIQLKKLQKQLETKKININFSEKVVDWISAEGYVPTYGARPVKRVIQKNITNKIAEKILASEDENLKLEAYCQNDEIFIKIK